MLANSNHLYTIDETNGIDASSDEFIACCNIIKQLFKSIEERNLDEIKLQSNIINNQYELNLINHVLLYLGFMYTPVDNILARHFLKLK